MQCYKLFTRTDNSTAYQWKLAGGRVRILIFEAEAIPFVTCKSEEGLGSFCRNFIQSSQPMDLNMEMYTQDSGTPVKYTGFSNKDKNNILSCTHGE